MAEGKQIERGKQGGTQTTLCDIHGIQTQAVHPTQISSVKIYFQAPSEGRVLCMFEGIKMLKPSEAEDTIIPGI